MPEAGKSSAAHADIIGDRLYSLNRANRFRGGPGLVAVDLAGVREEGRIYFQDDFERLVATARCSSVPLREIGRRTVMV